MEIIYILKKTGYKENLIINIKIYRKFVFKCNRFYTPNTPVKINMIINQNSIKNRKKGNLKWFYKPFFESGMNIGNIFLPGYKVNVS